MRYTRERCAVKQDGKPYAVAKDTVAAANIVDALNRVNGRI
jgi:hypothetical protein